MSACTTLFARRLLRNQPDLEQLRPQLPSEKKAIAQDIVGDAVQDVHLLGSIRGAQQPGKIDPPQNLSVDRRKSDDPIALPHIGINFAAHVFQFIQKRNRMSRVTHREPALLQKTTGVPASNLRATIAHVDLGSIICQAPTFAWVVEET